MDVKEIIKSLLQPEEPGGKRPTQAALAKEIGVAQATISKWLGGTQLPDFHQTQTLRKFAIEKGILIEAKHDLSALRTVAIVGAVGLGEEVAWYDEGNGVSLDLVELPFPVPEGCFALEARGTSMHPRVKDGEIIIARRNDHAPEELINQEVVLKLKDGTYLFKTLRRGYGKGLFNLESHNGPLREDEDVEWVAELWAIIPSRKWVRVG